MSITFYKSADSILDYELDLSGWLKTGDTISSYVPTATTVTVTNQSATDTAITVWVDGTGGSVDVAVVTTGGREETFTLIFLEAC